jgi:hypothetical protein
LLQHRFSKRIHKSRRIILVQQLPFHIGDGVQQIAGHSPRLEMASSVATTHGERGEYQDDAYRLCVHGFHEIISRQQGINLKSRRVFTNHDYDWTWQRWPRYQQVIFGKQTIIENLARNPGLANDRTVVRRYDRNWGLEDSTPATRRLCFGGV